MCFYLFHFCLASIDKLCVYFFWYQKAVTNSRCDGDQSPVCDAAARASHTSRALALHHWCWCQTVTVITFVSFVNAQNEADIRSDTSHNYSCAFVVCSSRKDLNFYKGKHSHNNWTENNNNNNCVPRTILLDPLGPHSCDFIASDCHIFEMLHIYTELQYLYITGLLICIRGCITFISFTV